MKALAIALALLAPGLVQASTLVCSGQVDFYGTLQKFTVTVEGEGIGQAYTPAVVNRVVVSGASLETPNVFTDAKDYWDGHSSGMITAPGFSMSYDHIYGRFQNITVTTDFRGDIRKPGMTVGHVVQSKVIATCAVRARGTIENLD
ncbi:MAG: hypothetical protein ACJ763_15605 [Bdellovibrionia bacterium]